jgi:hypothetical protein
LLETWGSVGASGEALQPESRPARRPASPREANFKRRRAVRWVDRAEEEGIEQSSKGNSVSEGKGTEGYQG